MDNAIFLNSPYLGGAERSIINQSLRLKGQTDFFVPYLDSENELSDIEACIREIHGDVNIIRFPYPKKLFSVSRSGEKTNKLNYMLEILNLGIELKKLGLARYKLIWGNGNKISFPLYITLCLLKLNSTFIWHLRDYPYDSGLFKVIWRSLKFRKRGKTIVMSNSRDVMNEAKKVIKATNIEHLYLYNPVGDLHISRTQREVKTIGVVSMLAPWKGVHVVAQFEKKYRSQLKSMGVEEVAIFGGDIYLTSGEHRDYVFELKEMIESDSILSFKGKKSPREIYTKIDCLIHCSIKPEPFGRVIIEAFSCHIPVISTALGGSGELVVDRESGLVYDPENIDSLFEQVKLLVESSEVQKRVIEGGEQRLKEVEAQQEETWGLLFSRI